MQSLEFPLQLKQQARACTWRCRRCEIGCERGKIGGGFSCSRQQPTATGQTSATLPQLLFPKKGPSAKALAGIFATIPFGIVNPVSSQQCSVLVRSTLQKNRMKRSAPPPQPCMNTGPLSSRFAPVSVATGGDVRHC